MKLKTTLPRFVVTSIAAAGLALFASCTVNVDDPDPAVSGTVKTTTTDYNPYSGTTTTTQRTTSY